MSVYAGEAGAFSRYKSRTQSLFATRRPWRELLAHPASYSIPFGFGEFSSRLKRNLNHFRVNYSMIVLFILFLSLLYHPVSMMVFTVIFAFWFLLYFFRDEPIVVFGRMVDDRGVLIALGIVTIVGLILTHVWINVLVSVLIGAAVILLHGTFRVTEDLFLDEEEAAGSGLHSVVGGVKKTRAKELRSYEDHWEKGGSDPFKDQELCEHSPIPSRSP